MNNPRPATSAAAGLSGGAASIDITPELGMPLAGSSTFRPAKLLLDPLRAKALALDDGTRRVAILTADLIGFERAFTANLRQRAQAELKIDHLVCNGSHTHSGPECRHIFIPVGEPGVAALSEAYFKRLEASLMQLLRDAVGKLEPVTIAFGIGSAHFGINRRRREGNQTHFLPNPK